MIGMAQQSTAEISIHALRVEGDVALFEQREILVLGFLSTPSGWRATESTEALAEEIEISIHALRVEGDQGRRLAWLGAL